MGVYTLQPNWLLIIIKQKKNYKFFFIIPTSWIPTGLKHFINFKNFSAPNQKRASTSPTNRKLTSASFATRSSWQRTCASPAACSTATSVWKPPTPTKSPSASTRCAGYVTMTSRMMSWKKWRHERMTTWWRWAATITLTSVLLFSLVF